jgi:thiamine-phosphate pyrophosphorylase
VTDAPLIRGLYAIADTALIADERLLDAVTAAIEGGAAIIQYRDKAGDAQTRRRQAGALARLCRDRGVPFIVNDDPVLALNTGAAGVHVGRGDLALAEARDLLGPGRIIGVSCYNELARARDAARDGADYVAFGSFFPSPTKPGAVRAEPALLRAARAEMDLPIVAIGGISVDNAPRLIEAGADAIAVISGIFAQPDIRVAAAGYARLFVQ